MNKTNRHSALIVTSTENLHHRGYYVSHENRSTTTYGIFYLKGTPAWRRKLNNEQQGLTPRGVGGRRPSLDPPLLPMLPDPFAPCTCPSRYLLVPKETSIFLCGLSMHRSSYLSVVGMTSTPRSTVSVPSGRICSAAINVQAPAWDTLNSSC